MKVKVQSNIIKNKLLALKILKLNIYKKIYNFLNNLNIIKLNLKHIIQIIYKYKTNHKQILIINTLNNVFFYKLNLIKFLLLYWNKILSKSPRLFLKNHLILFLNKQLYFHSLYKANFVWIPLIFLKNNLYWYINSNLKGINVLKGSEKTITYNFLWLLLNINEFQKPKN